MTTIGFSQYIIKVAPIQTKHTKINNLTIWQHILSQGTRINVQNNKWSSCTCTGYNIMYE